jgi:hypothetical protein
MAVAGRDEPRERYAARKTNGALADGKAVWSWHPLLVSSLWRYYEPNRVRQNLNPQTTVTRRIRSPGRARYKPLKPLRVGMPGRSGGPAVTTLVWFVFYPHARLRVHWAPGIPHALCFLGRTVLCATRANRAAGMRECVRRSSCPDLIRASINLRNKLSSKKMDHRVKPGNDDKVESFPGCLKTESRSFIDRSGEDP